MSTVFFSKREEIINAITHGIGALLAIAASVVLIVFGALHGNAWHIVSFSVFGSTLIILYVASTLYHSLTHPGAKHLFRKFDHISIFLLIAGTYTPFCLLVLKGWIGWTLFGIVWTGAITGIVFKAISVGKLELLSTLMYILIGWAALLAIKPLYDGTSFYTFSLLIAGGLFYTAGTFFFIKDKLMYFHSIWHLFVMAGSILHFFSVLSLVI
jgi:hemolysin III